VLLQSTDQRSISGLNERRSLAAACALMPFDWLIATNPAGCLCGSTAANDLGVEATFIGAHQRTRRIVTRLTFQEARDRLKACRAPRPASCTPPRARPSPSPRSPRSPPACPPSPSRWWPYRASASSWPTCATALPHRSRRPICRPVRYPSRHPLHSQPSRS